jgi:AraC-like DNA-binding protein
VTPDGVLDLLWFRDQVVVAGPDTVAMTAHTEAGDATHGLRLAPGLAHELLGVPIQELTDRRVDLADLVPTARLHARSFQADPAGALEDVLLALWTRADADVGLLRRARALDQAAQRGDRIQDMARELDLSERSVHRLGTRLFGYGPTVLRRIHRFRRAQALAGTGMELASAAATAGYSDQAHFTREARRLSGRTPAQLLGPAAK